MTLAFSLVLMLEKIVVDGHHHHSEEERRARRTTIKNVQQSREMSINPQHIHQHDHHGLDTSAEQANNKPKSSDLHHGEKMAGHSFDIAQPKEISQALLENPEEDDEIEEAFKSVMRTATRFAHRVTVIRASQSLIRYFPLLSFIYGIV